PGESNMTIPGKEAEPSRRSGPVMLTYRTGRDSSRRGGGEGGRKDEARRSGRIGVYPVTEVGAAARMAPASPTRAEFHPGNGPGRALWSIVRLAHLLHDGHVVPAGEGWFGGCRVGLFGGSDERLKPTDALRTDILLGGRGTGAGR